MHAYEVRQTLDMEVLAGSAHEAATMVMEAQRIATAARTMDPDPAILFRVREVHIETEGAVDLDESYALSPN